MRADKPSLQPSPAEEAAEPVLLILADISGYTRYMTANARTLSHSHTIIAELIEAIAGAVEIPMEIVELEGDAIFLFCRKHRDPAMWKGQADFIGRKLMEFFQRFRARLGELRRSNVCTCHACAHIDQLSLKILVHSGEVLIHRVLQFNKLSGVDVILIHRLLKNSVGRPEYLLLTDAAHRDLRFRADTLFEAGSEEYEHLGRITTFVHYLQPETVAGAAPHRGFSARYRESLQTFRKLWFGQLSWPWSTDAALPARGNAFTRLGLSVVTLLLTPFIIPAGAFLAVVQACKSGPRVR